MAYMSASGGSKIPPPKYIFIKDIQEKEAVEHVFPEIGRRGGHVMHDAGEDSEDETTYFGNWPGVSYTPEDDAFYALLYAKQGRGISAFLFNHKQELGPRRIKAATIWHSEKEQSYCVRFEMEDSPEPETGLAKRSMGHTVMNDQPIIEPVLKRHDSFDLGSTDVYDAGGLTRK